MLRRKQLYHPPETVMSPAGNSYVTRRKQLCQPPDTEMSHRRQLYHSRAFVLNAN